MQEDTADQSLMVRALLYAAMHSQSPHIPKRLRLAMVLKTSVGRIRRRRRVVRLAPDEEDDLLNHLRQACAFGDSRRAQHLLARLPNTQDPATGETPLFLACSGGHTTLVKALLAAGANCYLYDNQGVSPLMKAARQGATGAVLALLQEGEADAFHVSGAGRTALMEACVEGHVGVVHILLTEAGVDIRQADETTGNHALLEAVSAGQLTVVKTLVGYKGPGRAKVNQTDKQGNTALILAARMGDEGTVRYLIHQGAKQHIATYDTKRTPLMEAACMGFLPVVQCLLKTATQKDLTARDHEGRRAVDLAGRPPVRRAILAAMQAQGCMS